MMDFKGFDKPNFCGEEGNFKFPGSCEDEDDVRITSLGACSSKQDASVKKKTVVPAKRLLDNNDSLHNSVKKSKVSPYDDREKNDDIHLSDLIKRLSKSTDDCFSMMKKKLALIENSYEECEMTKAREETRLQSIKRDIEECCKELENKKKKVSSVNEAHDKMQRKIEECMEDFVVKKGQLYLMDELIEERKQELKIKEIELFQVKVNTSKEIELCQSIDKDRGRKEEELKALYQKIAEFTLELKAKEKELDAMDKLIGEQAEKLDSERKNVCAQKKEFELVKKQFESKEKDYERRLKELESRERKLGEQMEELESKKEALKGCKKELESKEKKIEGREMEIESKQKLCDGRVVELVSKEKDYERRLKELESREKKLGEQMEELESKKEALKGCTKELESKEKKIEGREMEIESKQKLCDGRVEEFESTKKKFEDRINELLNEHESKVREFDSQVKEFECEKKHFENQVEELKSKERKLKGRVKELESKENEVERKVNGLKFKKKQFEGQVKDHKSKLNKFDEQSKESKSRKNYIDVEKESELKTKIRDTNLRGGGGEEDDREDFEDLNQDGRFKVRMHNDGFFVISENTIDYKGGSDSEWSCDPDRWSYHEIFRILNKEGYPKVQSMYYKAGGKFKELMNDDGAMEMVTESIDNGIVDLYVAAQHVKSAKATTIDENSVIDGNQFLVKVVHPSKKNNTSSYTTPTPNNSNTTTKRNVNHEATNISAKFRKRK